MGYCPFPALGRDTVGGVVTEATGVRMARREHDSNNMRP